MRIILKILFIGLFISLLFAVPSSATRIPFPTTSGGGGNIFGWDIVWDVENQQVPEYSSTVRWYWNQGGGTCDETNSMVAITDEVVCRDGDWCVVLENDQGCNWPASGSYRRTLIEGRTSTHPSGGDEIWIGFSYMIPCGGDNGLEDPPEQLGNWGGTRSGFLGIMDSAFISSIIYRRIASTS